MKIDLEPDVLPDYPFRTKPQEWKKSQNGNGQTNFSRRNVWNIRYHNQITVLRKGQVQYIQILICSQS